MPRACARSDDLREVGCELLGRQAAQAVVAAERDDQHPHVAVERPVEPRQSAGRRIAGDAGVHDLVIEPRRVETLLQQRRIRRGLGDAEAGGQAVAEHDDARARAGRRRGAGRSGRGRGSGRRLLARLRRLRSGQVLVIVAGRRAAGDRQRQRRRDPDFHQMYVTTRAAVPRFRSRRASIRLWAGVRAAARSARARASASSMVWRLACASRSSGVSARPSCWPRSRSAC